jgi:hypothetical protein
MKAQVNNHPDSSPEFIYTNGRSVRLYLRRLAHSAFPLCAAFVSQRDRLDIGLMI